VELDSRRLAGVICVMKNAQAINQVELAAENRL
jgi:hypothetical protein